MAGITIKNVCKVYDGNVVAVSNFNLNVEDKEFLVLVGPSGCGKSTVLRMIAGLEDITEGDLFIGDRKVNKVHPKDRDIAMVFQNYALYPHMTVYDNMAFGLKLRKVPSMWIEERVLDAAQVLDLETLLNRRPKALSGGQRQRVALGRSMVRKPKVFLLDEPLSNLDAKLRVSMRSEIVALHRKLNVTFVYVTHDQVEAMTMATKMVVMKDGLVQQVDSPQNVYDFPNNKFVATFIGLPEMNLFDGVMRKDGEDFYIDALSKSFKLHEEIKLRLKSRMEFDNRKVLLGVRPEYVREATKSEDGIEAEVDVVEKLGNEITVFLKAQLDSEKVIIYRADKNCELKVGDKVKLTFDPERVYLFDAETEETILKRNKYLQ